VYKSRVDVLLLLLAGTGTALATGLGALPVWWLGESAERLRPALWGVTVGIMGVASVVGLLEPALDTGSTGAVIAGIVVGVAFLLVSRRRLDHRQVTVGGLSGPGVRRSVLVFGVLAVHSLPEGLAIGTAYASDTEGLGLFVILAIALQNVPEGTSVAIPMEAAGFSRARQFWAAVATSAPQPFGALVAYALVEQVESLLPFSFAFAAGAMLALVVVELAPQAFVRGSRFLALAGTVAGGLAMVVLAVLVGV
jgi:ZIP family zinc transporter